VAPGSSIIFDHTYTSVIEGAHKRNEVSSMRRYERFTGEAIHFGLPDCQVQAFLQARGFEHVKDAMSQDLKRMYFTGANQKRTVATVYAIVRATVGQAQASN
jgi:O-methyltransferase involved in polyketide biosynthesis